MNTLQLNTLGKVTLGDNYLELSEHFTDLEFGALFEALKHMNGASLFWIGDGLLALEQRKGEHYTKQFEDSNYEPQTLRVAKTVCRRFPRELRAKVSFSHHRESLIEAKVNGITDFALALRFLRRAEESGMTVKEMRKAMRLEIKASLQAPVSISEIINDPAYIKTREAIFCIRRYLEGINSGTHPIARGFVIAEVESLWELAQAVKQQQGNN